ncbi:MAG: family 43 glycosylhydrolase [Spirochaetaceae bacterium]|jgi:hypothetical protein|nr:family 43 glycosylhydrolase [Spirochaetaceae bacterium]
MFKKITLGIAIGFVLIALVVTSCSSPNGSPGNTPSGYPKTMEMANPLFWQFQSQTVNWQGALVPGGLGPLYTADGSARVWNIGGVDTLFVYASHDMVEAAGCDRMDRYHVFSTTDMKTWTDYGEIFNADDVPWHNGSFINGSKFMWAPDCVYKNGVYYYYFPHPTKNSGSGADSWGSNWQIGIATSQAPAAGFTILNNYLTGLNNGAENQIDPHVFIDTDGAAYFYNGGGGRCYGGKLKDNMVEIDGDMRQMQGLDNFHEASWVHKYNGKYYLSYSDNGGGGDKNGDQLKYAMSDNPLGPWESKGVYVYATGNGTIHGSIVQFNNKWYAFYHSDYASYVGNDQGRSVHVDELFYNSDGTIQLVKTFGEPKGGTPPTVTETSTSSEVALSLSAVDFNQPPAGFNEIAGVNDGGRTYGYLSRHTKPNGTAVNTNYRKTVGMAIESQDGKYNLGELADREFTRYTINAEKAGLYQVDVYAASSRTGGTFFLAVNGVNSSGTVTVPNTIGAFTGTNVENIPLRAGENVFELRVLTGGFKVSRFEFRVAEPYQGTPYKGTPHAVPGTRLEAEDFDLGGEGVAYHDTSGRNNGFYSYRTDNPADTTAPVVDIESGGGRINICWTQGGEWVKYTLNITETGTYSVKANMASNNSSGSIYLTFNDIDQYPTMSVTTSAWNVYTTATVEGVRLEAGTTVMTMTVVGNVNIDWYEFTRTGP